MLEEPRPLFSPGRLLVTPAAAELLAAGVADAGQLLARHLSGDWGEVDEDDQAANDRALIAGDRLLSVYGPDDGRRLWVITDAMTDEDADPRDRPVTTVLRPSDY